MKNKLILLISIIFIVELGIFKASLTKKEGLKETLYIDNIPIYTRTTKWKGLDSKNRVPEEIITANFSLQWEGFLYLETPKTFQIAYLCNSICKLYIDGNLVGAYKEKPDYHVQSWKGKSNKFKDIENACDGNLHTRATTSMERAGGEWLRIDLQQAETVAGLTLNSTESPWDISRTMEILLSRWNKFYKHVNGTFDFNENNTHDFFFSPIKARFIKLINRDKFHKWWSIHELYIYSARNLFRDKPSYQLSLGNHPIKIIFQKTPELTNQLKTGGRALCKIFIKSNHNTYLLDNMQTYTCKTTILSNFINRFFWFLISIPLIYILIYSLKTKSLFLLLVIILISFFFLYLFSLTPNQNIFTSDGRMFYTDNYESSYMIGNLKGSYQQGGWNDTKQHLIFPMIIHPLYKFGEVITDCISNNNNLKLVFPIAFLGLLNILTAFFIFKSLLKNSISALVFAVAYGLFFGIWFYASFPETYILTITFINLFLLITIRNPDKIHQANCLIALAIINATAVLVSFHLMSLAVIPLFCLFFWERKSFLPKTILYLLITMAIVIISYQIAGTINKEFSFIQIMKYLKDYQSTWGSHSFAHFINIEAVLNTVLNFFFYSIGIIYVPPWDTSKLSFAGTYFNTISGTVFIFSYLFFIVVCLRGLRKTGFVKERRFQILLLWICVNILYFIYFNPQEAFLYGAFIHLPWLVILGYGYKQSSFRYKKLVLGLFILALFLNNLHYIYLLKNIRLYP